MVRRAAALLSRDRWVATGVVTAAIVAYTAGAGLLWDAGLWPDILFLSLVLFPLTFSLVWLLLPLWRSTGLFAARRSCWP